MEKFWQDARNMEQEIIDFRRDFHKYAESGWTEFRTASIIYKELSKLGFEVFCGNEVIDESSMMGVPAMKILTECEQRAISEGADSNLVRKMSGGKTGVMGVMKFSNPGRIVALRFDMDANDVSETTDSKHRPCSLQFNSIHENVMHACGHDGHVAIGLGIAKIIAQNKDEFCGTVKLIFQPAEEGVRGAKAMVAKGIVDDVDYFFGFHLGVSTTRNGLIAAMTDGFLATTKLDASFKGLSAHAGAAPQRGKNALLAAAQASISLHTISRHGRGASRINVGTIDAGTGRNILPDVATIKLETRGATTDINNFMVTEAKRMIKAAADLYDVEVEIKDMGEASSCVLDLPFGEEVHEILSKSGKYREIMKNVTLGGSEDCAYFMERVQSYGGQAIYMMLGSELKAGHHSSKFDFDEKVLAESAGTMAHLAQKFLAK